MKMNISLKIKNQGKLDEKILSNHLDSLAKRKQGFLEILDDDENIHKIEEYAAENHDKYDNYVVLGIGGSALGAIALRDSLMSKIERKTLRVIDNVDPEFVYENLFDLDLKRTLFIVITKSGGTVETMSLYFIVKNMIQTESLNVQNHFVFVTDPKNGLLREIAETESIKSFDVPANVGGRFSVLSSVGLLPMALAGVNIRELIDGAKSMAKIVSSKDTEENIAYRYAHFQYENYLDNRNTNVLFPYSNALKTFGEWYSQLLAESTGKIDKNKKQVGLTPVTALGATDQHSQLQLYAQGPDDKTYTFMKVNRFKNDYEIYEHFLENKSEKSKFPHIVNLKLSQLLNAELEGTYESLTELNRPVCLIEISQINPETVGGLIVFFEMATALLGELLEINAFDQPGVERSKVITKEILNK